MPPNKRFSTVVRDLATYPHRFFAHWIRHTREIQLVLLGILGSAAAAWEYSLMFNCGASFSMIESCARITGTALQLLGLIDVATGIRESSRLFGKPSTLEKIRAAWDSRPRLRRVQIVLAAGAVMSMQMTMRGSGGSATVSVPKEDFAQRLDILESRTDRHAKLITEAQDNLTNEAELRATAVADEAKLRQVGDDSVSHKLDKAMTGGLHLEVRGLWWLGLGTAMAGVAPELQKWLAWIPAGVVCPMFASM